MLDQDLDPTEWIGLPTDDQMWRQQAALCARESNMLIALLTEQRVRLTQLTDSHNAACRERGQLQAERWRALQRLLRLECDVPVHIEQKRKADE